MPHPPVAAGEVRTDLLYDISDREFPTGWKFIEICGKAHKPSYAQMIADLHFYAD
jgi:hypothetical protein